MTRETDIAARVEALLERPVAAAGFRLLEVQYRHEGRWVLRLVIDRADGAGGSVGLDDCTAVSEVAGRILDVEDPIPQAFSLEVTSPGVFRPLKEPRHFRQSVGQVIRVHLAPDALPERKQRDLRGRLEAMDDDAVVLAVEGEQLRLPLAAVQKARLDPEL